ncbi:MAG: hypothetical protein IIA87_04660 [Nanoarchaeota archaeon]|nr:hypothetical protein [Nanoarchaeota archaeon]
MGNKRPSFLEIATVGIFTVGCIFGVGAAGVVGAGVLFDRLQRHEQKYEAKQDTKLHQETELYQRFSEVADTNAERIQIYEEHGLIIPLPNLTDEQTREYLVSHHREDGDR